MVEAKVNLELAVIVERLVADFARIYLDVATRVGVGVVHLMSFLKNIFFPLPLTLRIISLCLSPARDILVGKTSKVSWGIQLLC